MSTDEGADSVVEAPSALLDPLGDDLARRILVAATAEVVTAGDLAAAFDVSDTTVYRQLNRLTDVGYLREVTDAERTLSSKTGYQTHLGALFVGVSDDGIDVRGHAETDMHLALPVLLDHVTVEEATVNFDSQTVEVTLDADPETLSILQNGFRAWRSDRPTREADRRSQ